MQVFTNRMRGCDHARNVHANDVTHKRKFMHGIDSSV